MIIAEELDANWESIRTETAPANSDYKNPEGHGGQNTGGSNSVKGFWNLLQETGAAAREMLVTAAAQRWNVPLEECDTKLGNVIHKKYIAKIHLPLAPDSRLRQAIFSTDRASIYKI